MPNTSLEAIAIGADWTDLVAANGDLAGVDATLQFNGAADGAFAVLVFGGAAPAAGADGYRLASGDSVAVNAAAIWARSPRGGAIAPVLS